MFKYLFKKNKNLGKLKNYQVSFLLSNSFLKKNLFKNLFKKSAKISFTKKFTMSIIKKKKIMWHKLSICHISAKHRSNVPKLSLKRHTIKYLLTQNQIPNIIKKTK